MKLRDELDEALRLLRKSSAHIYRQQFAGKHTQDKEDATALLPEVDAFIERHDKRAKRRKS